MQDLCAGDFGLCVYAFPGPKIGTWGTRNWYQNKRPENYLTVRVKVAVAVELDGSLPLPLTVKV